MRLYGAMLFVKDLPRMTGFYRDVLGLQPIEATRQPDWVEFDGAQFSLHAIPAALGPPGQSVRPRVPEYSP